jgi:hypothetical protein
MNSPDWGLQPLDTAARHDLLEIVEERHGRRSTIITSQPPVEQWHALIGDPTYADAILDRLVHTPARAIARPDNAPQRRIDRDQNRRQILTASEAPCHRARSSRNHGRDEIGMVGDFKSE